MQTQKASLFNCGASRAQRPQADFAEAQQQKRHRRKGRFGGIVNILFCAQILILNFLHNKTFSHKKSPFHKGDLGGCSISFFVRKISDFEVLRSKTYSHKKG